MDERDPLLNEIFLNDSMEAEFNASGDLFREELLKELSRLQRQNSLIRRLKLIAFYLVFMAILGLGLAELATIPIIEGAANPLNNLVTPLGVLGLLGWKIWNRIVGQN